MRASVGIVPAAVSGEELTSRNVLFFDAVEQMYAGSQADAGWRASLDAAIRLFDAAGGNLEVFRDTDGAPAFIEFGTGSDQESARAHTDYRERVSATLKNADVASNARLSRDRLDRRECDSGRGASRLSFVRRIDSQRFLAAQFSCAVDHQVLFAIRWPTSHESPGDAEIDLFERLLPHLRQAVGMRLRMDRERSKCRQLVDGLERRNQGCIVIDSAGTVLHAGRAAREMIDRQDGITVFNCRLAFADALADHAYRRAVDKLGAVENERTGTNLDSFCARRPSGKRPYVLSIRHAADRPGDMPFGRPAAAIAYVRDPDSHCALNTALLGQSYGLSATEAHLAAALDRGYTLREFAERRNVSISTARSQLYTLMSKLDVNRQTDLVRLLSNYR